MKFYRIYFLLLVALILRPAVGESEFPKTNIDLPSFCGPNCLTVFLKMNKINAKLDGICKLARKNRRGTSFQGLQIAAHAKGIYATGVKVTSARTLKELGYPAIVVLKNPAQKHKRDHFVLVTGYDGDGIKIVNPPYTPYIRPMREFDKQMEDNVLLLSTSPIVLPEKEHSYILTIFALGVILIMLFAIWLRKCTKSRFLSGNFGMDTKTYPSDLIDEQCQLFEPLLPPAKLSGRPRTADMRQVPNGIFS